MKKELRPVHDEVACEVCGRTTLKGERTEYFLEIGGPGRSGAGERKAVCELCTQRASRAGWIRESAGGDFPAAETRAEPKRPFLARLRGRREESADGEVTATGGELPRERDGGGSGGGPVEPAGSANGAEAAPLERPRSERGRRLSRAGGSRQRDPRHVRAVPTTAEVKIKRALELFNASSHIRTVAGLAKTLGSPWVSVTPAAETPSEVAVVVAWELSWYRYRVELGDEVEPVILLDKGEELRDIESRVEGWNGSFTDEGGLAVAGVGSRR